MIKAIGTAARKELEKEFSKKVNLQLWVKANKNWTNDINKLKKFLDNRQDITENSLREKLRDFASNHNVKI